MRRGGYGALLGAMLTLAGCSNSDETGPAASQTLRLELMGLPTLANGYHYEGWAIIGGSPVSTGTFNVDAGGALVTTGGAAIPSGDFATGMDLSGATAIVITVEPANDTDAGPAATHVLAGPVSGSSAALTVAAPQALGSDFGNAAGAYILATPTNGPNTSENSGIWFLDPAGPGPGLTLPTLPSGWMYEGWAVVNGTPLSTGKFLSPTGADESAPYSSTMPGPPFPGEDFLNNAPAGVTFPLDLSGGTAVITIEPDPDDSPMPFGMKPLVGAIPAAAVDHTAYTMANQAANLPQGTATIH